MPRRKEIVTIQTARNVAMEYYENLLGTLPDPDSLFDNSWESITDLRRITKDPHVSSCIETFKSRILSMEYTIDEPSVKGLNDASTFKKEVIRVISSLDVYQIIQELLEAVNFGFIPSEIIWETKNLIRVPVALIPKPPEYFVFNYNRELLFLSRGIENKRYHDDSVKVAGGFARKLPKEKFIVVQNSPSYENPYGKKFLVSCAYPVMFKQQAQKLMALCGERFGMGGFLTATIDDTKINANPNIINETNKQLKKMTKDAVGSFRKSADVKFMSFNGQVDGRLYRSLIDLCNDEISKLYLGHTITTDVSSTGSRAIAEIAMMQKIERIDQYKRMIEGAFNTLIMFYFRKNYETNNEEPHLPAMLPKFVLYEQDQVDKTKAERDKVLFDMGMTPNKTFFKKHYNLDDDTYTISNQTATQTK
jgi:hypothetical protein